jgi:hypothetical protein
MKNIFKNNQGLAFIEFAFILPVLLILAFPVIDYARFILLQQKTTKAAYVIADAISMSVPIKSPDEDYDLEPGDPIDEAFLRDISARATTLIRPFNTNYALTITNIGIEGAAAERKWQYTKAFNQAGAAGTFDDADGAAETLPANLTPTGGNVGLADGDNIIRVTFTAQYSPITPELTVLGVPFLSNYDITYTSFYPSRGSVATSGGPGPQVFAIDEDDNPGCCPGGSFTPGGGD